MGNHRRGREPIVALNAGFDAVGGQHFQSGALSGTGSSMRILAHEQRAIDTLVSSIFAEGLGNGEDVRLGECAVERRAAMATGAKTDELRRIVHVRPALVIIAL